MKLLEFLDQIWKDEMCCLFLNATDEERSLVETLKESNYILESPKNVYKITIKGKLRIFYAYKFY